MNFEIARKRIKLNWYEDMITENEKYRWNIQRYKYEEVWMAENKEGNSSEKRKNIVILEEKEYGDKEEKCKVKYEAVTKNLVKGKYSGKKEKILMNWEMFEISYINKFRKFAIDKWNEWRTYRR